MSKLALCSVACQSSPPLNLYHSHTSKPLNFSTFATPEFQLHAKNNTTTSQLLVSKLQTIYISSQLLRAGRPQNQIFRPRIQQHTGSANLWSFEIDRNTDCNFRSSRCLTPNSQSHTLLSSWPMTASTSPCEPLHRSLWKTAEILTGYRPTNFKLSSRPPVLRMLSPSGLLFSQRYGDNSQRGGMQETDADIWIIGSRGKGR